MEEARAKKEAEKQRRRQDEVMPVTTWEHPEPARAGRRGVTNSPRIPPGTPPQQPIPGLPAVPHASERPPAPRSQRGPAAVAQPELAEPQSAGGMFRDPVADEAARKAAEKDVSTRVILEPADCVWCAGVAARSTSANC